MVALPLFRFSLMLADAVVPLSGIALHYVSFCAVFKWWITDRGLGMREYVCKEIVNNMYIRFIFVFIHVCMVWHSYRILNFQLYNAVDMKIPIPQPELMLHEMLPKLPIHSIVLSAFTNFFRFYHNIHFKRPGNYATLCILIDIFFSFFCRSFD